MTATNEAPSRLTPAALLFSFSGRIDRGTFLWPGVGGLALGSYLLFLNAVIGLSPLRGTAELDNVITPGTAIILALMALFVMAFVWACFALAVKRLHDRGRSGWLALLILVPPVNLWPLIEIYFLRGTAGPNRFGPAPHRVFARPRRVPRALDFLFLPVLALAVFCARTVFFEPDFIIDNGQAPALFNADFVLTTKYDYGYGPYSCWPCSLFIDDRLLGALPERGDIVIYRAPKDSWNRVNRVVGLPGDHIQLVGGILLINGVAADRTPLPSPTQISLTPKTPSRLFRETLPDGPSYSILQRIDPAPQDDTPVFDVPDDSLFVIGDHRDNSIDSRYPEQVGFVPMANLIGRVRYIWLSGSGGAGWWPSAFRWSRVMTEVR